MKKIFKQPKIILFLIIFIISISFIGNLNAQVTSETPRNLKGAKTFMEDAGTGIGYNTATTQEIFIGNLINVALSLIGIFFLILVILGGYQWMTAGGNEESIAKAKKRITNATIGLTVVLMAYAISYFIIYMISQQTLTPLTS
jgi:type IV secretion system pilin